MVPAGNSSATSSISVTDTIGWIISFICWTAAYIQFHRSTLRYRTPCLPPLIYALNFAWELNLGLFTPPNRLLNIVYSLWAVGDLVLIHNQIRYGGIDLWGFVATLAVATATEAAVVKTCVSVLVSGTGTEGAGRWGWEMFGLGEIWQRKVMNGGMQTGMGVDRLGVKGAAMAGNEDEMARMMATFWLGYICQMGVSFWSLWIVSKGQGKHLEYSSW